MRPPSHKLLRSNSHGAFTLAEVLVAVAVCLLFGIASFATNERLLVALKSQKETTAATMMLQERMEAFRSLMYSGVASNTTSGTTNPPTSAADVVANTTTSEAPLGTLTETITVSAYQLAPSGTSTTHSNVWQRNAAHPTGTMTDTVGAFDFAGNYDLIKVDIQLSWTSAGGRTRNRELSAIFGKGNRGS
jgi:type II secretory pathway pseudopilin PulG